MKRAAARQLLFLYVIRVENTVDKRACVWYTLITVEKELPNKRKKVQTNDY